MSKQEPISDENTLHNPTPSQCVHFRIHAHRTIQRGGGWLWASLQHVGGSKHSEATHANRDFILLSAGILSRAYGGGDANHREPSHNDLPIPQGDWHEKHQQTQARYNTQLAGSVLLFVGVIAYVSFVPVECIIL